MTPGCFCPFSAPFSGAKSRECSKIRHPGKVKMDLAGIIETTGDPCKMGIFPGNTGFSGNLLCPMQYRSIPDFCPFFAPQITARKRL